MFRAALSVNSEMPQTIQVSFNKQMVEQLWYIHAIKH